MSRARRPLRLGLLGTGVAARELYLPAFRAIAGQVDVVACSNRRVAKARAYAKLAGIVDVEPDAHALFARDDLDAVFISLPIDVQPDFVLEALRCGKPVVSEKPIAADLARARRVIQRARRFSVPWLVGENFEFMPHVKRLRSWLSSGRLGEVRLVEVNQITQMDRRNPYYSTAWRKTPKHIGGFVVDAGVHLAHVVRRCFGMPKKLEKLSAQFDASLPPVDTVVAAMEFESGALGTWRSSFCARFDGPMLRVFGSKANASLGHDWIEISSANGRTRRYDVTENSFALQLLHMRDVVFKGAEVAVSPEDAFEDLRLMGQLVR